jgi:hypothetical protein
MKSSCDDRARVIRNSGRLYAASLQQRAILRGVHPAIVKNWKLDGMEKVTLSPPTRLQSLTVLTTRCFEC